MSLLTDADTCLRWVASIASVGILISSLEALSLRTQFRDDGLFSWRTISTRWSRPGDETLWVRVLGRFLAYPNVLYVLGIRAAAAALLLVFVGGVWSRLGIAVVFFTNALILGIRPGQNTGSDRMARVIFGALFLAQVVADSPLAAQACVFFLALQASLSYAGNGWHKLRDPTWREGAMVFDVTRNRMYGYAPAARYLRRHPLPGKLLTWGTLIMECLFPLVLVVGHPACWVFLAWGLAFHLLNTFFVGLNNFFWTFTATYPAILYSASQVERMIHRRADGAAHARQRCHAGRRRAAHGGIVTGLATEYRVRTPGHVSVSRHGSRESLLGTTGGDRGRRLECPRDGSGR